MKKHKRAALVWFAVMGAIVALALLTGAAQPTGNIPISGMAVTTQVQDRAYFPLIQPAPGKTTNDNFRATISNLFIGRGSLFITNVYATNIYTSNFFATNIFIGSNSVSAINPTDGYVPYRFDSNTFGDSPIFVVATNEASVDQFDTGSLLVTNLSAGGVVTSFAPGWVTNLPAGLGALTNDGANNLGWSTAGGGGGGDTIWTNDTVTTSLLPGKGASVDIGKSISWWVPDTNDAFVAVHDAAQGEAEKTVFFGAALDDAASVTNFSYVRLQAGSGGNTAASLSMNAFTNGVVSSFDVTMDPIGGQYRLIMTRNGSPQFQIADESSVYDYGAFVTPTLNQQVIGAGTNVIDTTSQSIIEIASLDNSALVELSGGNGYGHHLLLVNGSTNNVFTMVDGSGPAGEELRLRGDWVPTDLGDSLSLLGASSGWVEIGRQGVSNSASGTVLGSGTPEYIPKWDTAVSLTNSDAFMSSKALGLGSNTLAFFGSPLSPGAFYSVRNAANGDTDFNELWVAATLDGTLNNSGGFQVAGTDSAWTFNLYGNQGNHQIYMGAAPSADQTVVNIHHNGADMLVLDATPRIIWGPGTTNVLYRDVGALVYTNGDASLVVDSQGSKVVLTNSSGTATIMPGGSASALGLRDAGTNEIRFFGNAFIPLQNTTTLGSGAVLTEMWGDTFFASNAFFYGFLSGTNYSRLRVRHDGTNDAIALDSQSSGTGGTNRPIALEFGGTNLFQFDGAGKMSWSGTTNILQRNSTDLEYTNRNSFGTYYRVSNDGTNYAQYGVNGNVAKVVGPAAIYLQGSPGSDYTVVNTAGLVPSTVGTLDLGSTSNPWQNLYLTNNTSTNYIFFGTNRLSVTGNDLYWNGTKLN